MEWWIYRSVSTIKQRPLMLGTSLSVAMEELTSLNPALRLVILQIFHVDPVSFTLLGRNDASLVPQATTALMEGISILTGANCLLSASPTPVTGK